MMNPSNTAGNTHSSSPDRPDQTYTVFVVELNDVVERRHPDLPNVYVGVTVDTPEEKLTRIQNGHGPAWVKDHAMSLRPDLSRWYVPTDQESARQQKAELRTELSRRGYTVNRESTGVWNLYIVQLDEGEKEDAGKGWVYIGESSRSPAERLEQHLSGARNHRGPLFSRVVHRHGQHLRTDLMRGLPNLYSLADSKQAEAELAERLRDQGYVIEGGH
jgi:hypothetical protein